MIKKKDNIVEVVHYYFKEIPTSWKISDLGYFHITAPYKMVIGDKPITSYGVTSMEQFEKIVYKDKFAKFIFKIDDK